MSHTKAPVVEPLPGYRLLSLIGEGGFGEVWKCEAPGGFFKAIKFIASDDLAQTGGAAMRQERGALERLRDIRHPFLLSVERVEVFKNELMIVMELADENLRDVLHEYSQAGEPGIPRDDLLKYLTEAAEALDVLNEQYDLLHLDIKPDNIFLVADHAKVGDFGLVSSIPEEKRQQRVNQRAGLTPLYASPEVWTGQASKTSDQYSLAITYHELRTGRPVFEASSARQLMLQHTTQEPDLHRLPLEERWVIARALHKNPLKRFDCCRSFLHALRTGKEPALRPTDTRALRRGRLARTTGRCTPAPSTLRQRLDELMRSTVGTVPTVRMGQSDVVGSRIHYYVSPVTRGLLRMRLAEFRHFWNARAVSERAGHSRHQVTLPAGFQSRYPNCRPTLEIDIRLNLPRPGTGPLSEIEVVVQPTADASDREHQMAGELAPLILGCLSGTLDLQPERRRCDRIEWDGPFLVRPVGLADASAGKPITCQGINLSFQGVGFLSPVEPDSPLLRVQLGGQGGQHLLDVLVRVIRVTPSAQGFEIGAAFCEDAGGLAPPEGSMDNQTTTQR